ncbi:hypothetical protein [Ancylobacter rudongensis]|uniref:DNA primase n=1 Tax=Ancylobacter rudongensis TaxID=177413 RepID=A0A1G4UPZ4_9HYPH|nr:hypothetical protein [Ancylobacter rudongensis]SCW95726.1 DNA primase [Ancylobacter rudongensis]
MASSLWDEIEANLDMEFFLDRESLAYRITRGVSGEQLNIKQCPNPNCGDSRWRVYFGTDTGRGNCFVCGKGFGKTSFIRAHFEHTDWAATARECEALLKEQGWRPRRKAVVAVEHGDVVLPISIELPTPEGSNLAYLETRGIDAEICRYFRLRFCEYGWWKFTDPDGAVKTQSFDQRVIIPVFDLDGKLVTFQGRDVTGMSQSKYLFPKELPGTGRYLYNAHNVVATDHVVMGEGAFDVAALKIAFDEDPALRDIVPIGSFGKHLSYGDPGANDQLGRFNALKARGLRFVTIMWDGEERALEAALNAAKLLSGIGLTVRIALLPHERDPNEVLPEVVRKAHYAASTWTPALDIRWRLRNPYSPRERVRLGLC